VHELVFNMCDSNMHGERIKIVQQQLYENCISFRMIFFSRISSFPPGWPSKTVWLHLSWPCLFSYLTCNKVPRFSCSGAQQILRIGSLHPPRHPVIAFVLRDTFYNLYSRPIFFVFSQLSFFRLWYSLLLHRPGRPMQYVSSKRWHQSKILLGLTTQRTTISITFGGQIKIPTARKTRGDLNSLSAFKKTLIPYYHFFFCGAATQPGSWLPHSWGFCRSHTTTHHSH
jgi:hypothetical protein